MALIEASSVTSQNDILILHRNAVFRLGLLAAVKQAAPTYRIRTYPKAEDSFSELNRLRASSIIMLDSSAWATLEVQSECPSIHDLANRGIFIALIASIDQTTAQHVETRGIRGLFPPNVGIEVVRDLLEDFAAGRCSFHPEKEPTLETEIYRLSNRQLTILRSLCRGRLVGQISKDLGVSQTTVKEHFGAVRERLGFQRRNQVIAAFAPHFGGIELD
jgi:DNA-binding NarL/FixJ family response regulator